MRNTANDTDLFQLIDQKDFNDLVEKWELDKWVQKLKTREFTCALITAMSMRLQSFREIELALRIPRSTFSDALSKRCSGFFMELCDLTLLRIRQNTKDRKIKRAVRQILAIDSTEVRAHGSMFSTRYWNQRNNFGKYGAAKIHLIWNVSGQWVEDHLTTGSCQNDSPIGRHFKIRPNCTYVFDRAYNNLKLWLKIMDGKSHFVTRLKQRSVNTIRDALNVERCLEDGVLYDGTYAPASNARACLPKRYRATKFRFIVYRDAVTKKIFHFVTSDWDSSALNIAHIYKDRWAVELLFRWFKGHLNIRYLPTKSINGAKVQVAIAVLIQLLLQLKKIVSKFKGTLWELLRGIRMLQFRQSLATYSPTDDCRWRRPINKGFRDHFV